MWEDGTYWNYVNQLFYFFSQLVGPISRNGAACCIESCFRKNKSPEMHYLSGSHKRQAIQKWKSIGSKALIKVTIERKNLDSDKSANKIERILGNEMHGKYFHHLECY